jgi:hypothetical protein
MSRRALLVLTAALVLLAGCRDDGGDVRSRPPAGLGTHAPAPSGA